MDLAALAEEARDARRERGAPACSRACCARGFTTVRDAGGADWGLAQAVERGLIRGPAALLRRPRAVARPAATATSRRARTRRGSAPCSIRTQRLLARRRRRRRGAQGGARGTAPRRVPGEDHGVGRRRLADRPDLEPPVLAWTRCARSSRRRTAGAPTRWRTPTRPRRSRARCAPACARIEHGNLIDARDGGADGRAQARSWCRRWSPTSRSTSSAARSASRR